MSFYRGNKFKVDHIAATVGSLIDPIAWWDASIILQYEYGYPEHLAESEALEIANEEDTNIRRMAH